MTLAEKLVYAASYSRAFDEAVDLSCHAAHAATIAAHRAATVIEALRATRAQLDPVADRRALEMLDEFCEPANG